MKTLKLHLTILLIALFGQSVIAQKTAPTYKKFSIGISATPSMSYRYLPSDGSFPLLDDIFESRNESEIPKISYSAGLNFQYHLSTKIGIELGAQYTSLGYTQNLGYIATMPIITDDPSIPREGIIRYNFDYLEIPAKFIVSPGTKKVRFSASAGVITGILLNAWQKNIYNYGGGQKSVTTQNQNTTVFRSVIFSPQVSLGATYNISQRLKITAEPMIRYAIQTVADSPIKANLYAGGVFIGLYFNL